MKIKNKEIIHRFKSQIFFLILIGMLVVAVGCTSNKEDVLMKYPVMDMSGYHGLRDSQLEEPYSFVELTVKDVEKMVKNKESFVFLASFAECPWCNAVIEYIEQAARESDCKVGIIDTRKDTSWESNTDILDYDIFVELFGEYLEKDEDGMDHLYVPHIFFIKDGNVVYQYQGALPEMGDNPNMELNDEQKEEITDIFREGFKEIR